MPLHTALPSQSLKSKSTGFTLIEMVVTVAIVGILAAIAVPSYRNYVVKSHVKGAGADLVALALIMENQHQLTLVYPPSVSTAAGVTSTTSGFAAFGPAESALFIYTIANPSPTTGSLYQLVATGKSGTVVSGCALKLESTNARGFSSGSGTSACGGLTTW